MVSQLATTIAGRLFAAALAAGLMGLLCGVGSWFARSRTSPGLASRLPAWAVGVTVGLSVAGLSALFATFAEPTAPLWPSLTLKDLAAPALGALVDPIGLVWASGVALFILLLIDRGTGGWTHRVWMAALFLVLISCTSGLVGGGEPLNALVSGVVKGLVSFVFLWLVLRYDLRAIPAFLATEMLLEGGRNAVLEGTVRAGLLFALSALVTVAVAWAVTRYIAQPLVPRPLVPIARSPKRA